MRLLRTVVALALATTALFPLATGSAAPAKPPVNRVFIYVLENTSYADVVGNEAAPYLNSLIKKYASATNYTATGHASLDNYIAMTSGQMPNPGTSGDCIFYGTPLCIQDVPHIGDQLEAKGLSWRAYMDGMKTPCQHTPENTPEQSQTGYSPRHNPFVYYRDVMGNPARCAAHVVPFEQLWKDQKAKRVPNYTFISPDTCHDAHDTGAACDEGGGIPEADKYAARTIPRILADPSFTKGGLLFVTFDEGGVGSSDAPFSVASGTLDFGGHIYTVLVSPNVAPGVALPDAYDHYSQLKTVEDIFCLDYLAGAGGTGVRSMIGAIKQARCAKLPRA